MKVPGDVRVGVLLGSFVVASLLLFHRGHFSSSDELGLYETTRAIAERTELAIPPVPNARVGHDGRTYTPYALGQAVLALPLFGLGTLAERTLPEAWRKMLAGPKPKLAAGEWELGGRVSIFAVLLYGPLMAGVLAALLYALQRELGASSRHAVQSTLIALLCSYPALLAGYFLRHLSEGVAVLGGLLLLLRWRRYGRLVDLAAGTLVAALTVLVRLPAAWVAIGFAVYVLPPFGRRFLTAPSWSRRAGYGAALVLPVLAILALHALSNQLRWGTWFASPMIDEGAAFDQPPWLALGGFLFGPGVSIFAYSPILILLPWSYRHFWKTCRPEAIFVATVAVSFGLFFSFYERWPGLWSAPGPRYLFVPILLLMLPLGPWLGSVSGIPARVAVGGLAAVGFGIQLVLMSTSFSQIANTLGYAHWESEFGFLFVVDGRSPIPAAASFFTSGHIDLWIAGLVAGWRGQAGSPQAGLVLLSAWVGIVTCLWLALWRAAAPESHDRA